MPQQATTAPALAPAAPAAPSVGQSSLLGPPPGTPRTAQELRALRDRRAEVASQLENVASRRNSLARELARVDVDARAGLKERIAVLDQRIKRLEQELDLTGQQLAATPLSLLGSSSNFPDRLPRETIPIAGMLSVFVLLPLAIAISRNIWKRGSIPRAQPAVTEAAMQRLDSLQQSVDTIAIEVERISEGQRFVTRLLNERPPLGAGAAEPLRAEQKAGLGTERR